MGRLPVASPATMAASPEAGPSAGGKAPYISAMVKTAEGSGTHARVAMWGCGSMESRTPRGAAAMKSAGVIEIPATVIEIVAIDNRSAVGDIGVVVINR
jgi:hypothetical protein